MESSVKPPVYSLVDFKVRSEKLSYARRRMRKAEQFARSKPGVLQFHFLQDHEDPTVFTGYGIFASNNDLESYRASMKEMSENDHEFNDMLDPKLPMSVRVLDRI